MMPNISQKKWPSAFAVIVMLGLASCDSRPGNADRDSQQGGKPTVYVANYPLKYFAERIGGDDINVRFPAPHDVDPAHWMPDSKAIAAYQKADLILLNGAAYAKWVSKVSLPESKTVDTSAPATNRYISVKNAFTHQHGKRGEHSHAGTAFTTWLDPEIALIQARSVTDALTKLLPSKKESFQRRFAALRTDLNSLDTDIRNALQKIGTQPVLFSHPVYQYFEHRYQLNGRSLHWEPDVMPSEKQWAELEELLKTHPAKWMFWEGEPRTDIRQRLRRMNINSVTFSPCGNVPPSGDFLGVMRKNLKQLRVMTTN